MGQHRAEDQPDKKSTSEQMQGTRDEASKSKHAAGKIRLGRPRHDKPKEKGK